MLQVAKPAVGRPGLKTPYCWFCHEAPPEPPLSFLRRNKEEEERKWERKREKKGEEPLLVARAAFATAFTDHGRHPFQF
jgi:hypothetical protein